MNACDISSTIRIQTDDPFGGAALNRISMPPVAIAKLDPIYVVVCALVRSCATSRQRMWVPRCKPLQFTTAERVRVAASMAVEAQRPKNPIQVT
jgi:hypothetical protein